MITQIFFREQILTAVEWANNDTLVAIWMTRIQNEAFIVSYETSVKPVTSVIVSFTRPYLKLIII